MPARKKNANSVVQTTNQDDAQYMGKMNEVQQDEAFPRGV